MAKLSKVDQARKNRRSGKGFQTKVAKFHGGKNVGGLGGEDIEHHKYSIEVKYLVRFAGLKVMNQAIKNCPESKMPICHVHIVGEKYKDDLIILRFGDFQDITGSSTFEDWKKSEREKRRAKKNG